MMTTFEMEVRMTMEKIRLQKEIRDRFGDWQIQARQQSLCQRCLSFDYERCKHGLLPVTSEGSDCPYYQEGNRLGDLSPDEEENDDDHHI